MCVCVCVLEGWWHGSWCLRGGLVANTTFSVTRVPEFRVLTPG